MVSLFYYILIILAIKKISIIGAGFVGSTAAHWIASENLGDIVLLDRDSGVAKGKALDLLQCAPIAGFDIHVSGTDNFDDTKDSDIVVITAGSPRKPGMSRDELLAINTGIVKDVSEKIAKSSPNAILIVVTNPLDAMVYTAWKASEFTTQRVVGMAGILDSSRMRTFLAMELEKVGHHVSPKDISAMVLGGHGDTMIPVMSEAKVNGKPVSEFLSKEILDAVIERTRNGGAEIVSLLKTGSAYYAPGISIMEMARAILHDEKKILPCAAYVNGEYGVSGIFIGVPAVLGKNGVEKIVEIPLTPEEQAAFQKTATHVQNLIQSLR